MRVLRILVLVLLVLFVLLGLRWLQTAPQLPERGTESARRLAPGPYPVATREVTFVDRLRTTDANGDFAGAPERTLVAQLWYPDGVPGAHPLAVYSHSFMARRHGGAYIARHLASHGYVVVSADFPLTNFDAPGGPRVEDAVNQPGDVSFLITSVSNWTEGAPPFAGHVDPERIGVFGLSLGGLTTTLVSFHAELRDPRVRAAVSIAGPGAFFGPVFFETARVPFLMIAGDADAMVDYGTNAAPIPGRIGDGGLLTLAGASHAGFDQMAAGALRLIGNPDRLGCWALTRNLHARRGENPFGSLGGPEIGIVLDPAGAGLPCETPPPSRAMNVGRQHAITLLATTAFFESRFAATPEQRAAHVRYLESGLAADFPDVRYEPAPASR
jgi:dienelactone hydrolase